MSERFPSPEILTSPLIERLKINEQWEACVKSLVTPGIVETLRRCKDFGIVGFDGKEYPIPSENDIRESLIKAESELSLKAEQGFTELVLTPIALPLETQFKRLETELRTRGQQGRIFAPGDHAKPLTVKQGTGNDEGPLWRFDEFVKADVEGTLLYYPKRYAKDTSEGQTKKQLLATLTFPGWIVELQEAGEIPAEGKGDTRHGWTPLAANKSPNDYLPILQNAQVKGMTIEGWIARLLKALEERDEVIDDYQGKGKVCWNLGNYHLSSGGVPSGYWNRGDAQAYVCRYDPGYSDGSGGSRAAVGISRVS